MAYCTISQRLQPPLSNVLCVLCSNSPSCTWIIFLSQNTILGYQNLRTSQIKELGSDFDESLDFFTDKVRKVYDSSFFLSVFFLTGVQLLNNEYLPLVLEKWKLKAYPKRIVTNQYWSDILFSLHSCHMQNYDNVGTSHMGLSFHISWFFFYLRKF